MSNTATIYSIQESEAAHTLHVEQVWPSSTGSEELPTGYTSIFPFTLNDDTYMLMYDKVASRADVYLAKKGDTWMNFIFSQQLSGAFDIMAPFLLANNVHILAYSTETGTFEFYQINQDVTLSVIYTYTQPYGDDATPGYTTVAPFTYRGSVYYLCYNFDTGKVTVYQLSVPATKPLRTKNIFLHQWADGWTRFAFFQLGGENFFLKTNIKYVHVNIDHIVDDPSKGSHPVCTHLDLSQDIDAVAPFYMGRGDPYFISYKRNGATTFNRFHGDCQGWTQEASLSTVTDAGIVAPFQVKNAQYVLIY